MDTLFFWISKLVWIFVSPGNLLVILAITSLVLFYKKSYKYAQRLMSFIVCLMFIIFLFPIGEWLLYPLETRYRTNPDLPKNIDGYILLGGAENEHLSNVWQQIELGASAERDLAFMSFMRQHPDARYVFTGGSGSLQGSKYTQADVVKKLLRTQGLKISNVVFEQQSRNTYENAKLTYALVKPEPNESWVLITTGWHMPRAMGVFHKAGWPVIAFPVDHYTNPKNIFRVSLNFSGNLRTLEAALKEWIGLTAYWITGKMDVSIHG